VEEEHAARVRRAVSAALKVARDHGIPAARPQVLHESNNVVIHLQPSPIVAKVSPFACQSTMTRCGVEVAVGRHLARAGAPVVGPCTEVPPGPHTARGCAITLWGHHKHDATAEIGGPEAIAALDAVHHALEDYPGPVESFLERRVRRTGDALERPVPNFPPRQHAFLRDEFRSLRSRLDGLACESRILHGDPHRGNFLVGGAGYLLIDFESLCFGPREWDLSALPEPATAGCGADEQLLKVLRRLRSVCVAVWCATRSARSAALERAAGVHLALLRRAA
jgi:Phosphotransferase enzyme family